MNDCLGNINGIGNGPWASTTLVNPPVDTLDIANKRRRYKSVISAYGLLLWSDQRLSFELLATHEFQLFAVSIQLNNQQRHDSVSVRSHYTRVSNVLRAVTTVTSQNTGNNPLLPALESSLGLPICSNYIWKKKGNTSINMGTTTHLIRTNYTRINHKLNKILRNIKLLTYEEFTFQQIQFAIWLQNPQRCKQCHSPLPNNAKCWPMCEISFFDIILWLCFYTITNKTYKRNRYSKICKLTFFKNFIIFINLYLPTLTVS